MENNKPKKQVINLLMQEYHKDSKKGPPQNLVHSYPKKV